MDTDKEIEVTSAVSEKISESSDAESESSDAESEVKSETESTKPAPSVNIIGFCVSCGVMVNENNLGQKSPTLMCKNCINAQKEREIESLSGQLTALKKKKKKAVAWGIVTMVLAIIIGSLVAGIGMKTTESKLICVGLTLIISYCAFAMVCEIIIDRGPMFDILEWGLESPLKLPGIIFEWDLDGIVSALCLKIFFSILGFLAGVAMFGLAICVGLIVAPFTFPFNMSAVNKEIKDYNTKIFGTEESKENTATVEE